MESVVVKYQDVALEQLENGVSRKVLAYLPAQMVVEVRFEQGAFGTLHAHPHTQCTYVREGEFVFSINGSDVTVREGDTIAFAPNEVHGCVCRRQGVLIDVFTPMREDFIR